MTTDCESDRASLRVVRFLAERRDVDPATLPPLGRRIDPDALDAVVESLAADEHVRIDYDGTVLYVWGDGDITADED